MRIRVHKNPRAVELYRLPQFTKGELNRVLKDFDKLFRKHERKVFRTEGAHAYEPWPKLSPRYERWKKRNYPGRRIMVLTGKLRRAWVVKGSPHHYAEAFLKPKPKLVVGIVSTGPRGVARIAAYHRPGRMHNPKLPIRDTMAATLSQVNKYKLEAMRPEIRVKLKRVMRAMLAWRRVRGLG